MCIHCLGHFSPLPPAPQRSFLVLQPLFRFNPNKNFLKINPIIQFPEHLGHELFFLEFLIVLFWEFGGGCVLSASFPIFKCGNPEIILSFVLSLCPLGMLYSSVFLF
jgi:hypothetical protein